MSQLNEKQLELLSAWVDGEVTDAEKAEVQALLEREETRDEARAEIEQLRKVRELVAQGAAVKVPEDLTHRVLDRIGEGSGGGGRVAAIHQFPAMSWRTPAYAIAAALLIALGVMFGPAMIAPSTSSGSGEVARESIELPTAANHVESAPARMQDRVTEDVYDGAPVDPTDEPMQEGYSGGAPTPPQAAPESAGEKDGDRAEESRTGSPDTNAERLRNREEAGLPGGPSRARGGSAARRGVEAEGSDDEATPPAPRDSDTRDNENLAERPAGDRAPHGLGDGVGGGGAAGGTGRFSRARGLSGGGGAGAPTHELELATENRIAAQNELLWVAKLHGEARLRAEGDDVVVPDRAAVDAPEGEAQVPADRIEITIGESKLAALVAALQKVARDHEFGELILPEGLKEKLPKAEPDDGAEAGRVSDIVPERPEAAEAEKDETQVRLIVRFK
jgi:hypothetical protein